MRLALALALVVAGVLVAAATTAEAPGGPPASAQGPEGGSTSDRPRGRHGARERPWRTKSRRERHRRCITRPRPGPRWCPSEWRARARARAVSREALRRRAVVGPLRGTLERIASCESGGRPWAVDPSGTYRGKYQFDLGTWQSVGGSGDPAAAPEAEQDYRAALLYRERGPQPWPVCGYR